LISRHTVNFLLSERRDIAAAKRFFRNAVKNNGTPRVVTLDAYAAVTPSDGVTESDGDHAASGKDQIQQILEQYHRPRPSPD
jgi:transposase-like protein